MTWEELEKILRTHNYLIAWVRDTKGVTYYGSALELSEVLATAKETHPRLFYCKDAGGQEYKLYPNQLVDFGIY